MGNNSTTIQKYCKRCSTIKPITEFGNLNGKTYSYCKPCVKSVNGLRQKRAKVYCPLCDQEFFEKNAERHEKGTRHQMLADLKADESESENSME